MGQSHGTPPEHACPARYMPVIRRRVTRFRLDSLYNSKELQRKDTFYYLVTKLKIHPGDLGDLRVDLKFP
jgi:hypothetical protein